MHGIPGAVSILAQRDSFVKHVDDQHVNVAIHAPLLQNLQQLRRLQSLEQRAELGIGECKDTSGTFININPLETELFKLRCRGSILLAKTTWVSSLYLVTRFGKVLSQQRVEVWEESQEDLHQGCGELEWDVHQSRTTQSRGLESHTSSSRMTPSNSKSTSIRLLRTRRLNRRPRRAAPAPTPATTTSAPTAPTTTTAPPHPPRTQGKANPPPPPSASASRRQTALGPQCGRAATPAVAGPRRDARDAQREPAGELQKSRETGAELHNLTGAMTDIHGALGGSFPLNLLPY
ncbi:hypothetical protein PILCRDRAFT_15494 [Piloderma croceum F 1598]|uniref:Uncharacterized protein n=1 Tax=Piloderma croceum (strain F 1598) TaxID=765440 RepID=A0A0C3EZI9_PILCF|nr:hypothetical protein PILCRDRAFT_15494 [Piloderma croceum F 1598]